MGRGAATMYAGSLADADCIVIEGSNMAECHPVAFRWVMEAKLKGAKVIHVDPRFTRTSAMADLYAPVRAGSDIAFLGGLIRYVIENDKYFKDYVVTYTNAATIINDEFKDTEDLDGVFSGLGPYQGDPLNGFTAQYENKTWQYKRAPVGADGRAAATAQSGEQPVQTGQATQTGGAPAAPKGPPFDPLVRALLPPALPERDETLQHPRCVFQLVRRHYARYTPEMVERITGCPQATFLQVAEAIAANSGPERTTTFAYAVGWTQHTDGVQMIGAAALLQLLLGNMGRPGGGIMAFRGHATIQGSTDVPTLYHSIHGYMAAPSALRPHDTLQDYLKAETVPTAYWANQPKFMVSYLKSMYGDAATKDNDFGYDWHPKITGDHSHMPMMLQMLDGKVRGMFAMGQNPATSLNARAQRRALAKLEWLVVKDNFETETAAFWYASPEVKSGELKTEEIQTEVFLFPSAQVAEMDGSFTNTQRWIQWHEKAVDPPGDCRSDAWFTHQLALRLKRLYATSALPRDQGFKNLLWDFDYDPGTSPTDTRIQGEPDVLKILKEINGYKSDTKELLAGFGDLKDDGSTTCASWIYCGVYPKVGQNNAARRQADPDNKPGSHLNWAYAWPANRRIMYNRASARPDGQPWSERKKWIWWDDAAKRWVGHDVPDFPLNKAPATPGRPDGVGLDYQSGVDPFIMKADGKGWLFAPAGLVDGPLPTHYEPVESPVVNPLYPKQSVNPVHKYWPRPDNRLSPPGDPSFPYIISTYRLTEHHLSGSMSRWLPWLAELQPELFIELSPELAGEKGISALDWVRVSTPRGAIRARALVTPRLRPFVIDGKTVHHVGMPWHWGYMGIATGDVVNDLTAFVADPNVTIHEGKSFTCNVERLESGRVTA
jgi:formate dehydrogenase major subunit